MALVSGCSGSLSSAVAASMVLVHLHRSNGRHAAKRGALQHAHSGETLLESPVRGSLEPVVCLSEPQVDIGSVGPCRCSNSNTARR